MPWLIGEYPWLWIVLFVAVSELQIAPHGALYQKLKVRIQGDIMIGALFPIHEQPTVKTAFSRKCGSVREQYGIHRLESLIRTIHEINRNPKILPGIQLGIDARDTCWYEPIALEQCMDFIRTAFAYREYEDCMKSTNGSSKMCLPPGVSSSSNMEIPIAALIGPGSSEMTKQVQQVLQLFSIPQIGYSATAADLSNVAEYRYFLRVVPSDSLQVEVITTLLRKFNWTYVTLINSMGIYGDRGISGLKERMDKYGICSEIERSIDNKETEEAFVDLAMEIFQPDRKAKVVVCFCQGETMAGIFKAMKTLGLEGRGYMFIGTDGWSDRLDVLGPVVNAKTEERAYSRLALGSFSIKLHSPKVEGFDEYFTSLTPDTHHNVNPWFTEFWEQKFDCTIRNTGDGKRKQCTGQESLKNLPFQQDNKLSLLNLAIYVVALALHRVQEIVCGVGRPGVCAGLLPVNGSFLRQELLKVNFTDRNGDTIYFDENGDPPASYDILNYQQTVNARGEEVFEYVQIARWKHGRMEFVDEDKIQWQVIEAATPNSTIVGPVKSYCSEPCGPWEEKIVKDKSKSCCWICRPCKPNERKTKSERCEPCGLGFKPSENKTDCVPIEPEFIRWTNPGPLAAIVFAAIGALMAIIILVVFIVHRNTAVVKASTRELMWVILVAMLVAHFSVLIVFFRPSPLTCALHRSLPSIAFAIIYAALVTKTNRIARILEGSKRILLKKQRFLSTTAQLVITLALTTIEIIVVATMLVIEPPNTRLKFSEDLTQATMLCDTTKSGNVIPLAFPIFLIAMCTIYAIKTRNLPQNFNEAKFIGFTMYTTCVLWLAFLPVYLSGYETEVTLTISISISASIALVILFIPKTYIILCRPEKNSRMSFITAKDIRCHIGVLQTNVDTGKKKSHKKGPYLGFRKSSIFTEIVEMSSDKKISQVSRETTKSSLKPTKNGYQKRSLRNSVDNSGESDDSAASMQVALDEKALRRSFLRREKHAPTGSPPKNEPSKIEKREESCQTDWSLPAVCSLALAEPEEFPTDFDTD